MGQEKFDIYLCVFLTGIARVYFLEGRLGTRLYLWPKFRTFLIVPNFLRSYVLSPLATREATRMPSQLY